MLDDYFSLEISGDGRLVSLPMVFDDHVPSFDALPVCSKKRGIQRGTKSVSKILFQILDQISYITFCRVYNEFFVIATQRFHPQIETHDFELRLISILNFDKNGLVVANFTVDWSDSTLNSTKSHFSIEYKTCWCRISINESTLVYVKIKCSVHSDVLQHYIHFISTLTPFKTI